MSLINFAVSYKLLSQGTNSEKEYIVATSPVPANANYFLGLICEMHVTVIVMLDEIEEVLSVCCKIDTLSASFSQDSNILSVDTIN